MSADPLRDTDDTARHLGEIAMEAGLLLASIADRAAGRRAKDDGSPSTGADLASERLILGRLAEAWPGIPAVAEESVLDHGRVDLFFLVDPLDGTRDYLAGDGEYSVNIALIQGRRPVAAALAGPTAGRVWAAGRSALVATLAGEGSRRWTPVSARACPADGPVALVSRRHGDHATEACLAALGAASRRTVSSGLKFGLIASGEADLYVRCGPTMEWDTAAGDHVLTCAGGIVRGPAGPLTYGNSAGGYRNGPFAACGDRNLAARLKLPDRSPQP